MDSTTSPACPSTPTISKHFPEFPPDVLLTIGSFLPLPDLIAFSSTSRYHRELFQLRILSLFRQQFTLSNTFYAYTDAYGWRANLDDGKSICIYQGTERTADGKLMNLKLADWLYWHLLVSGYEGEDAMRRKVGVVFGNGGRPAEGEGEGKGGLFALKFLFDYLRRTDRKRSERMEVKDSAMHVGLWIVKQNWGEEFEKREMEMMWALMTAAREPVDYLDEALDEDSLEKIVDAANGSAMKVLMELGEVDTDTLIAEYDADLPCLMEQAIYAGMDRDVPGHIASFEFAKFLAESFSEALAHCTFGNLGQDRKKKKRMLEFKQRMRIWDQKPFPAHPPEITMMIASHLDFESLGRLAATSRQYRNMLKPIILQRWFDNYWTISNDSPHSYPDDFQLPGWRGRQGPGTYIQRAKRYQQCKISECVYWLVWFLVVSGYEEGQMKECVQMAFGGTRVEEVKGGLFAINALLVIMDLQRDSGGLIGSELGHRYSRLFTNPKKEHIYLEREAELVRELIAIADKPVDYFEEALVSEIIPRLMQIDNVRFLKNLVDCGKGNGDCIWDEVILHDYLAAVRSNGPARLWMRELHFEDEPDVVEFEIALTHHTNQLEFIKVLIKFFPAYLNETFYCEVRGWNSDLDMPSLATKICYEWLLEVQPDDMYDIYGMYSFDGVLSGVNEKEIWRAKVREMLLLLKESGADLDRALRFCCVDEVDDDDEYDSIFARLRLGMWEVVMWLLELGADPNAILPEEEDYRDEIWSPLHCENPQGYEKTLFYAFLESDYEGFNRFDTWGRVPARVLVDNILEQDRLRRRGSVSELDTKAEESSKTNYLMMLEDLLKRRPECTKDRQWADVLDIVHKEKNLRGRDNSELTRIVDEAEARREALENEILEAVED